MANDSSGAATRPAGLAWDDTAFVACGSVLDARALTSRWIGAEPVLALYGGGNTSVKLRGSEPAGRDADTLYVKGSGRDLSQVSASDFTALDLAKTRALLDGPVLDNCGLMQALAPLMHDAAAPRPSIETLMHAALPYSHVEHTHADSILAVINTTDGERLASEVFGSRAPLVPFRHSGFELARVCRDVYKAECGPSAEGMLLHFHGMVAFGNGARESFAHLTDLVCCAENYLRSRGAWALPQASAPPRSWPVALRLAALRRSWSETAGFPMVLCVSDTPESIAFAARHDLERVALRGPPTPQHAVFTKRLPALGRDTNAYSSDYLDYVRTCGDALEGETLPDPAPRIVIDPEVGFLAASVDAAHARMTATVFEHDIAIMVRACLHDQYVSLPPAAILAAEVHYGGFDRARLARRAADLPLLGCVVGVAGTQELAPGLQAELARAGADVVHLGRNAASALDALYGTGGLDVLAETGGPLEALGPLSDILPLSLAGGLRTPAAALTPDLLFKYWQPAWHPA